MNSILQALREWMNAPEAELVAALEAVVHPLWLESNPDLLVHPRDTVDPETLGMHQNWTFIVLPFREVRFRGACIYLFQFHIDELLGIKGSVR